VRPGGVREHDGVKSADSGERVVIVHEQIAEFGGGERVLEAILRCCPVTTVLAPRFEVANGAPSTEDGHCLTGGAPWPTRVRLVGVGGGRRRFHLAPVYARRIRTTPIEPARVVMSIGTGAWSLAASVPEGARHVAYLGWPARYLYDHPVHYRHDYPSPVRPLLRAALPPLRSRYRRLVRRPVRLIANSQWSARGLARMSGRPVDVIYPPVRTDFFTPAARPRKHILAVARLVSHKRIEVLVEAFRDLGETLVVAGGGPSLEKLRAAAPPNVRFTGHVEDEELRELYRSSRALVCPSIEEFGLCMAEAQATGIPVIAPRVAGAREIVRDRWSGILLDSVTPGSVAGAVRALRHIDFDPEACRRSAERFSEARFAAAIGRVLEEETGTHT
jgi:glycosyltransferase involved in cell wall biosynthesis